MQSSQVENLTGLPFNIGTIDGGVKANMIASGCELKFGFRPLPGQNSTEVINQLTKLTSSLEHLEIQAGFFGPCLPAANQHFDNAVSKAKYLALDLGIEIGQAVNFWTEASLFSQAGLTSLVFGPGNIAQAHTANEWVYISQLNKVEAFYLDILTTTK